MKGLWVFFHLFLNWFVGTNFNQCFISPWSCFTESDPFFVSLWETLILFRSSIFHKSVEWSYEIDTEEQKIKAVCFRTERPDWKIESSLIHMVANQSVSRCLQKCFSALSNFRKSKFEIIKETVELN